MKEVNYSSNFKIDDLGVKELDVYDIEVEANHNFFGNNILLHNSIFVDTSRVLDKRFPAGVDHITRREFTKKFNHKGIFPVIEDFYSYMTKTLNFRKNTLEMDFEVIADRTLLLNVKKRYVMRLSHDDGRDYEPKDEKLKITGIEIKRSNTPMVVRNKMTELVLLMLDTLNNDKCLDFLDDFKKEFYKMSIEKVSRPTGVKGMKKYNLGDKGLPINVRSSKIFNKALKDLKLKKIQPINEGEKIKFVCIKMPNRFHSNSIAFIDKMPEEIMKYIEVDYKEQYFKTMLKPVYGLFESVGWSTEKVDNALDDWF